jgi:tRNA (mo5U34)-methyltransferase
MLRFVHPLKRLYWRLRILSLGSWYYYIDFGDSIEVRVDKKEHPHSGFKNWDNFLSQHLPPLEGMRILDIGCNAGLYALRMVEAGAKEIADNLDQVGKNI